MSRRRLLAGGVAAPFFGAAAWPLGQALAATEDPFDLALRERLAADGVGFAAARVGPGDSRLHTAGVKRFGQAASIDADTLFELGSLTKVFVALLLADGVLQRRIRFEDAVEDYLPGGLRLRDTADKPLRLIDLATHRSGLPRMPGNLSPREMVNPYPGYTETRMTAFLREWKPSVERGQRFEYSNLGYGLLSIALSRQLGLSFDQALSRHILLPLQLTDMRLNRPLPAGDDLARVGAALAASLALAPRMAIAHDANRRPTTPWHFDAMAGAVGLIGSISSVGRFMEAALGHFDHPLRNAFAMCLQYRAEGEHPLHPFGLGWEMSTIVGADGGQRTLFDQDGATAGFSISMWLEPARGRGGAVLSNAFIETRTLALRALDPTISHDDFNRMVLPTEALMPMVGSYSSDRGFQITVRLHDGSLWLQEPAQQPFELLPIAPRRFVGRLNAIEFAFAQDDPSPALTVVNGDRSLLFRRLQQATPAASRPSEPS